MKIHRRLALLTLSLSPIASVTVAQARDDTLLNVSYDPTRELYAD